MRNLLIVAAGGALGAMARFALGGWVADRTSPWLPWGTFVVNVSGAFLIGIVVALTVDRGILATDWRLFLATGVLGGYTTFSAMSMETVALLERGAVVPAVAYLGGSMVLGLVAVACGLLVGRIV